MTVHKIEVDGVPVVTVHRAEDHTWVVDIDTATVPHDHLKDGSPDLRVWCNEALVMAGERFQDYPVPGR